MGTPLAGAGPFTINFKRQLAFRTGSAGIEITGTKDPAVMLAIVRDDAFPGTADIRPRSGWEEPNTGLVEEVRGMALQTIEGNTNEGGSRDGIGVFRRTSRRVSDMNCGFIDYGQSS